jgi:tryptophan synthase beta chain
MLHDSGRAQYTSASDAEALAATSALARTEGILPALESAHAIAEVMKMAPRMAKTDVILVNLSGRGDKDMGILAREMNLKGSESAGQPVSKPAKGQVQNNAD